MTFQRKITDLTSPLSLYAFSRDPTGFSSKAFAWVPGPRPGMDFFYLSGSLFLLLTRGILPGLLYLPFLQRWLPSHVPAFGFTFFSSNLQ